MAGSALTSKLSWELANPRWASILNPIIANPIANGQTLENVKVLTGSNTINHRLGKKLQGYIVTMNSSNVTYYDKQSSNPTPDLTLTLIASGVSTINLYVF